ncbi:MAG: sugar ABC transporter permease [Eubacteriales bacterium]
MSGARKTAKRKITKREKNDWIAAYIFIAPLVIGLGIFYIYPFLQNFWFSFNDVNKFNVSTFNGVQNYIDLFRDPELFTSLYNTFLYVLITVPIGILLSLFTAGLLNSKIRGKSFYRTIYFLPSVTMPVAVSLVWRFIFNGDYGVLNSILKIIGIQGTAWLANDSTALYVVMFVGIWSTFGYNSIILLAGMQGISGSYYEAAEIDGAGAFAKFFKITLPLVTPTIFFVLITGLISGFQVFDSLYMLVGIDNPIFSRVQTMNVMFYRNAFMYGNKGYAAAISIYVFFIIMVITVIQMIAQKKWVNYD